MRIPLVITAVVLCCGALAADVVPLRKLGRADQELRLAGDLKSVKIHRQGLMAATEFALRQTNLFSATTPAATRLPSREEREILWQTWKSFLDYMLALDALDRFHGEWFRLSGQRRDQSFVAGYAAFLAKYRCSLQFIDAAETNPLLDTILNDPVPELGLPTGTYARMKFRFLNVAAATDFAARSALYRTMRETTPLELRMAMADDEDFILKTGRGRGEALTAKNALKVVQQAGNAAWLPVQAGVAGWMGDTKVYRAGRSLISPGQIRQLQAKLTPGDVVLVRREWYLSNIGLPGFWPHAALYIGTPEERRRFFTGAEMAAWVRSQGVADGDFEKLLQSRHAAAHALSLRPQEKNHPPRIIEAMSEGVSFTTLEHSADGDSLVVLRPLLPETEKAAALLRAFHYTGRPYDFSFDFATDSELVCTELVFKAYEPAQGRRGLRLPLVEMLGRRLLPANEIARQFDSQHGGPEAQFQFVAFLDGYEREGRAVEAGVEQFRQSWRRPKWHVLTQASGK